MSKEIARMIIEYATEEDKLRTRIARLEKEKNNIHETRTYKCYNCYGLVLIKDLKRKSGHEYCPGCYNNLRLI